MSNFDDTGDSNSFVSVMYQCKEIVSSNCKLSHSEGLEITWIQDELYNRLFEGQCLFGLISLFREYLH